MNVLPDRLDANRQASSWQTSSAGVVLPAGATDTPGTGHTLAREAERRHNGCLLWLCTQTGGLIDV